MPIEDLPAVVWVDLNLPRVDRLEVLSRMRVDAKAKLFPVLVLTSCNEQKDILASRGLSPNRFFHKGVRSSEPAGAIRQLGPYWLMLNRPAPNRVRK